jgi:hypothetical protein
MGIALSMGQTSTGCCPNPRKVIEYQINVFANVIADRLALLLGL